MLMSTVLALFTATASTTTNTSNLALADTPQKLVQEKFCVSCEAISHVFSFQQQPRIVTGPALASGSPAIMVYPDKKGSEEAISHVFSFQQQPRIVTGPALASGSPAIMVYPDKKGSDSSSSTATPPSSTTSTAEGSS